MRTVAVEQGLSPVSDYLRQQGVQVVEMQNAASQVNNAAVMVITGGDKNLMGMEDVQQQVPVVSAEGLSPEQVYQRVKSYIQ
ncbi:YkuS family protein [Alicyclobacillus tolerans]|uniref:YkuS family protein n=1 Tax=Alicyclobacillus tolerans TaxID=90970 RepID=UPI001F2EEE0E|nr:YkuS family protein [Alicyclobacillus tolerans]MCF8566414.1 YkuS family protein [Alicyclobacillus tolerans]